MAILTEDQFLATMGTPMSLLHEHDGMHPVPLGDYFRSIPAEDFEGHDFAAFDVERVYRDPTQRWIHVMLSAGAPNVYLVIVIDELERSIVGHHLLDLNRVYGSDAPSND